MIIKSDILFVFYQISISYYKYNFRKTDGGTTTGWPAVMGATREFDLLSGKARKPPSVAGCKMHRGLYTHISCPEII